MSGDKARKLRMSIDNADWPEGVASQVDWLLQLDKETLRFGAFNLPFNWINNNVVFQKLASGPHGLQPQRPNFTLSAIAWM